MWPNPQETADLVTFTEEILKWKTSFFEQWKLFFQKLLLLKNCASKLDCATEEHNLVVFFLHLFVAEFKTFFLMTFCECLFFYNLEWFMH